jgi:hypothetical protein
MEESNVAFKVTKNHANNIYAPIGKEDYVFAPRHLIPIAI